MIVMRWLRGDRVIGREFSGCMHGSRGLYSISWSPAELMWPSCTQQCFDSSTDDQIEVFGNVFFDYRTIGSRTCNKKATHIAVSILKIPRLNNHNLSTNWVVTAEDVLSVVRFAGSACGHFPVYASNIKPSVWWNNEVKLSEQSFCFCFA